MKKLLLILIIINFLSMGYAKPPEDKPKPIIQNIININRTEITQKYKDKFMNVYSIQWKDTKKYNISSNISYDFSNNVVEARFFQFTYKFSKDWQEEEINKVNKRLEIIEGILQIKDNGIIVGQTKEDKDIISNGKVNWIK